MRRSFVKYSTSKELPSPDTLYVMITANLSRLLTERTATRFSEVLSGDLLNYVVLLVENLVGRHVRRLSFDRSSLLYSSFGTSFKANWRTGAASRAQLLLPAGKPRLLRRYRRAS